MIPRNKGGGANSFTYNFLRWVKQNEKTYRYVKNSDAADLVIVIADKADAVELARIKKRGGFILHRLDEYFEKDESGHRKEKHQRIISLNKLADITVFQSEFVFHNVQPYLNASRYEVILNGGDPDLFYPTTSVGTMIGHVSWSNDERKHFDFVHELIGQYPKERFLLIGNHEKTRYDFKRFPNARVVGAVNRKQMKDYYHQMKVLYLPSEKDPCPNTAIESILCGIPVCYNPDGGTKEIVKDCGLPLPDFKELLLRRSAYRQNCLGRHDLFFSEVAKKYVSLYK